MRMTIQKKMEELVDTITQNQSPDGAFRYCFEGSPMTDAYMIILLRAVNDTDEPLIKRLTDRLLDQQSENGAWKLYPDETEGNLSATIDAYMGLLYSGYKKTSDEEMKLAERFINHNIDEKELSFLTETMLRTTGALPWPNHALIPVEFLLLPPTFPVNFFDFSVYARVHLAPILLLADQRYVMHLQPSNLPWTKEIREDNHVEERSIFKTIENSIKYLTGLPDELHQKGIEQAERYMLNRIEPDGTLYSYFSATWLMIFALLSLGYKKDHPVISKAVQSLKTWTCEGEAYPHIENSTSTVWDTALLSFALQTANVQSSTPVIQRATHYLLDHQQDQYGDWRVHNPDVLPGGWGFSESNTMNPDIDDTTAALRAIRQRAQEDFHARESFERGVKWLLSMQNDDGGWPAFEKNTDQALYTFLPIEGASSAIIDPSTADLTGRTLEFLGNDVGVSYRHPQVKKAVRWLRKNQNYNGSWYGKWGVCYIYGTWAALTGLMAVGVKKEDEMVRKAIMWIEQHQLPDGGWGESCKSSEVKDFVSLGHSTPSQTAWALDALIATHSKPTDRMKRGIKRLMNSLDETNWTTAYPTGIGLPGAFYIRYHSYNDSWPLLTLAHYNHKYP